MIAVGDVDSQIFKGECGNYCQVILNVGRYTKEFFLPRLYKANFEFLYRKLPTRFAAVNLLSFDL